MGFFSRRAGASLVLGVGLVFAAWMGALAQTTVYVDDNTCPSTGTGSQATPYCKIQTAICNHQNAAGGAIVRVKPGNYNEAVLIVPNVQVISTDGPDVTFIDPSNKPCMVSGCTAGVNLPCSAVVFPEGSNGSRLEGFTVHNGQGLHNCSKENCGQIGGGIMVFASSPTITRNTIEDNSLNTDVAATTYFYGGGIYVEGALDAHANPVITRNLIRNNSASPEGGTVNYPSFGLGGGIYAGYNTSPLIRENTIQENLAGNKNLFQVGIGGGLAIYSGWQSTTATIQRNLIRANHANDYGGGIALGDSDPDNDFIRNPSLATLENNVIVENEANEGGGIYTSTTAAVLKHNTISDNKAIVVGTFGGRGGGIRFGPPGAATTQYQATLVNNIISFNQAIPGQGGGGAGGGMYVSTQGLPNPVVRYDDIFGNAPTNVAGSKTDSSYIGLNGNVSLNPDFVNVTPGSRNYRLKSTSPLIDIGDNSNSSPEDADGTPRPQVGPNGVQPPTVDIGAYEWTLDSDLDGEPDLLDLDDDNDGVNDASDCRPLDPLIWGPSPEIAGVTLSKTGGTTLSWTFQSQAQYDIVGGTVAALRADGSVQAAACLISSLGTTSWQDVRSLSPGAGYYYLIRGRNVCGNGNYGYSAPAHVQRVPTAPCP